METQKLIIYGKVAEENFAAYFDVKTDSHLWCENHRSVTAGAPSMAHSKYRFIMKCGFIDEELHYANVKNVIKL